MPRTPSSIKNAYKRSDVYRKQKKDKAHAKLKRRLETKKDEMTSEDGQQKKKGRLSSSLARLASELTVGDDVGATCRSDWLPRSLVPSTTLESTAPRT